MNWGWKIVLLFAAFVTMVLLMVFLSLRQDFHLVADNYYEKEIKYQGEIDKIMNARSLSDNLRIDYLSDQQLVRIKYPNDQVKDIAGEIFFFRPSDASMDQRYLIKSDEKGEQQISVKSLAKGLWQVKVNWNYEDMEFQDEKNLMFQ